MLVKATVLFLLGMVLVGMIGRGLFPRALPRPRPGRHGALKARPCPRCGTFIIGKGPCTCAGPARKV